jgi:hypothetical protein
MDVGMLFGLPAGPHVVRAKVVLDLPLDSPATAVHCTLTLSDAANLSGPFLDMSVVSMSSDNGNEGFATLPLLVAGEIPSGGTAVLNCVGDNVVASNVKITAVQAETLTQ